MSFKEALSLGAKLKYAFTDVEDAISEVKTEIMRLVQGNETSLIRLQKVLESWMEDNIIKLPFDKSGELYDHIGTRNPYKKVRSRLRYDLEELYQDQDRLELMFEDIQYCIQSGWSIHQTLRFMSRRNILGIYQDMFTEEIIKSMVVLWGINHYKCILKMMDEETPWSSQMSRIAEAFDSVGVSWRHTKEELEGMLMDEMEPFVYIPQPQDEVLDDTDFNSLLGG